MKPLFPALLLTLLPLGALAAPPPTPAQIEAAVMAMVEAEKTPAASTQDLLLQSMFTPRRFEHGPCWASTTLAGAYDCLVGMEIGLKNRYRMLRFVPQGMGWAMQRADVDAPVPPRKRGNRLAGLGLALLASIVLAALLAGVAILLQVLDGSAVDVAFLTEPLFYAPIALFFLATILIVAIVNTAPWWSYIVTSVLIGAAVYFGTAGIALLEAGVLQVTQSEANAVYFEALAQPLTIAAGLLAREVAIWTGAILGRRGRGVRARNVEDREAFEREQASLIPRA